MIGNNIKYFRKESGMTQDELAEELNVTRQALSNWERGKTEPDIETLTKIAEILNVSVEELIYGEEREEEHKTVVRQVTKHAKEGVGFGTVLAMVISYVKWQSIGWAILHGLFNWVYVVYYIIKYGWS